MCKITIKKLLRLKQSSDVCAPCICKEIVHLHSCFNGNETNFPCKTAWVSFLFFSFLLFFSPKYTEELFALAVFMVYVYPCVFCMALWSWQQLRNPECHLMLFFSGALSWIPRAIFSKLDTFSHVRELHRQMLLPKIPSSWLSC